MALNRPPHPTDPNFNQWIYQMWGSVQSGVTGFAAGVSGGNTAGATGTVNQRVYFQGGTNVTLSQSVSSNSATIVFSANGLTNVSMYANSNTLVSSSNTAPMSSLNFVGSGIASVGFNNGSIIVNVPAGGGAGDGYNQLQWTNSTADSTMPVMFAGNSNGSGNVTFGLTGSTFTASAQVVETVSSYAPPHAGLSTATAGGQTNSSNAVSFYPFNLQNNLSAGVLNLLATCNFTTVGTSSGRQTAGIMVGVYTRGTGTNSTVLGTVASQSVSWQVTGQNSSYTINQVTQTQNTGYGATGATNSSGVNITSGYTGAKVLGFPLNTLLTPGQYWLGIIATNSTSSINVGATVGLFHAVVNTAQTAVAPFGSFSSAYSSGTGADEPFGNWNIGFGSWTSAGSVTGLPSSVAIDSISRGLTQTPLFSIYRT